MNYTLLETPNYEQWFMKLHDPIAKKAMVARLRRIEIYGYFGDCKAVGDGVYELRIHTGGGIRIYYTERHGMIVVLLAGGNKSSQTRDIAKLLLLSYGVTPPRRTTCTAFVGVPCLKAKVI